MNQSEQSPISNQDTPEPIIKPARNFHWSWVWLVPLLALLVGLSLLASVWVQSGPVITISLESAAGIEAGQTKLRYRNVVVGEVAAVKVANDRQHVLVDVQLQRDGAKFITQPESKFWVVEPRFSISGVSGLDTIISGVYISVDAPLHLEDKSPVFKFEGLANPPEVLSGQKGTRFVLYADTLGSLRVGSRVFYRRIDVGRVFNYAMSEDGRRVEVQIFIDAPYDKYVTADTRFWNDSGIDMSVSGAGVDLRTSGLAAIIDGGISFAQADEASNYDGVASTTPAPADASFELFDNRAAALAEPDGHPVTVEMRFMQSVRGLNMGAEVEFRGLDIGKVIDIDLEYDPGIQRFYTSVRANLYPSRLGQVYPKLVQSAGGNRGHDLFEVLVKHGLKAQMRTASLLTGQQYISFGFFPDEGEAQTIPGQANPKEFLIPTTQGEFDRLQQQLGSIINKLDNIPIETIGQDLSTSMQSLSELLQNLNTGLVPQATKALAATQRSLDGVGSLLAPGAPIVNGIQDTLTQLGRAAQALRALAEMLQADPQSLILGNPNDNLR